MEGSGIPPLAEDQSPRRKHRATGRPRGGKRPGAGRKPLGLYTDAPPEHHRSLERYCRVRKYSPTLTACVLAGKSSVARAERYIVSVLDGLVYDSNTRTYELAPSMWRHPVAQEILQSFLREQKK